MYVGGSSHSVAGPGSTAQPSIFGSLGFAFGTGGIAAIAFVLLLTGVFELGGRASGNEDVGGWLMVITCFVAIVAMVAWFVWKAGWTWGLPALFVPWIVLCIYLYKQ
ncbi:MAG TPA: hypothetical protein VH482_36100 [Thermomicrobiales bacterium]